MGPKDILTNAKLSKEEVITQYRHLWQIEKHSAYPQQIYVFI